MICSFCAICLNSRLTHNSGFMSIINGAETLLNQVARHALLFCLLIFFHLSNVQYFLSFLFSLSCRFEFDYANSLRHRRRTENNEMQLILVLK